MSEELPETADKAIRGFIALFLLGAVLEAWSAWHHDEIARALEYWGVGAMLATLGVFWVKLREWAGPRFTASATNVATDFRWWVGAVTVILAFLTFSPFVERQQWPFSAWFPLVIHTPGPTADQIADAVIQKLPAPRSDANGTNQGPTAEQIADAVIKKLPAPQPVQDTNRAVQAPAFEQIRTERDNLARELNSVRAALPPKSSWLHIDDVRRWQIVKALVDGMANTAQHGCTIFQTIDPNAGTKSPETWGEVQQPLFYAGYRFTQGSKTFFPPGFVIVAPARSSPAGTCATRLKDLLDGLNVTPVSVRF